MLLSFWFEQMNVGCSPHFWCGARISHFSLAFSNFFYPLSFQSFCYRFLFVKINAFKAISLHWTTEKNHLSLWAHYACTTLMFSSYPLHQCSRKQTYSLWIGKFLTGIEQIPWFYAALQFRLTGWFNRCVVGGELLKSTSNASRLSLLSVCNGNIWK